MSGRKTKNPSNTLNVVFIATLYLTLIMMIVTEVKVQSLRKNRKGNALPKVLPAMRFKIITIANVICVILVSLLHVVLKKYYLPKSPILLPPALGVIITCYLFIHIISNKQIIKFLKRKCITSMDTSYYSIKMFKIRKPNVILPITITVLSNQHEQI